MATSSYSGDPSDSDLDWVRFRVQDTGPRKFDIADAEIASLLTDEGSREAALLAAAEVLEARFSTQVDKKVGDLSLSLSQKVANVRKLIVRLRRRLTLSTGKPRAGGISRDRKRTVDDNTDRVIPFARKDQFRHPGLDRDNNDDDENC